MSLDFPLSKVKKFFFFFLSRKGERGCVFAVFFSPIPEKEILDFIAHGSTIQVFTVIMTPVGTTSAISAIMGSLNNTSRKFIV